MNQQLGLDSIPTPLDERRRWQHDAEAWLWSWLWNHPTLFAEDVQVELAEAVGAPRDKAWLGPIVKRFASMGAIQKDGYRTGSNGSPKDVWRSMRYYR